MNRAAFSLIVAVAILVRLGAAVVLSPSAESLAASAHHEHASIARNLAEGRGFRFNFFGDIERPDLTSQQAPFVPGVLALSYLAFGVETAPAFWAVVLLQIVAGALACASLADAVGTGASERRLALVAGLLAALYPPFVVAAIHVQALPWNLLWISLLLAGAVRLDAAASGGAALFAAGAVGGLYTDPILAAVAGVLLLWIAAGRRGLRLSFSLGLLIALSLAPWIVRNYQVHGRFAFVKNSLPYVFWQGNTLLSAGTDKLLVEESAIDEVRQSTLHAELESAEAARKRSRSVNDVGLSERDLRELAALPNEAARMDWFAVRIKSELASTPSHYPAMCLTRLKHWLLFDETNPKSFVSSYRASYLTLAATAVIGLLWAPRRFTPFLLTAFALSAVHVLIITSARFRVCLELLMIPWAAVGSSSIIDLVSRLGVRRKAAPPIPRRSIG
jgi:hypothetical protein